ncbi:MAG: hypothetical protein ABI687_07805 [Flavitalea sp.]
MYENKTQKLAPVKVYYKRIVRNLLIASCLLAVCLLIGVAGYHYFAGQKWIDALHNASMILSGMGPVFNDSESLPVQGKIFSSAYALFSGVAFITNIGFILAPAVHRLLHKIHVQES